MLAVVGAGAVAAWMWWDSRSAQDWPDGAVPAIAAGVPADIREAGKLVIGVNVPYAPNEFTNSDGEIVGFDVDLMDAVTRTMGLTPEYRETEFDDILPAVRDGSLDVGMSSVTDTLDRQKVVDFVTYFEAGTLWAQRKDSSVDPSAACGLRVGVANSVIQETVEIPAKSDECVAAGLAPIEKVVFTRQDDVTAALIAGDIDAMSADSPVTGFAIKLSRWGAGTGGFGVRLGSLRVAGRQGLGVGRVAAARSGASGRDRGVQDHRDHVGGRARDHRRPEDQRGPR